MSCWFNVYFNIQVEVGLLYFSALVTRQAGVHVSFQGLLFLPCWLIFKKEACSCIFSWCVVFNTHAFMDFGGLFCFSHWLFIFQGFTDRFLFLFDSLLVLTKQVCIFISNTFTVALAWPNCLHGLFSLLFNLCFIQSPKIKVSEFQTHFCPLPDLRKLASFFVVIMPDCKWSYGCKDQVCQIMQALKIIAKALKIWKICWAFNGFRSHFTPTFTVQKLEFCSGKFADNGR